MPVETHKDDTPFAFGTHKRGISNLITNGGFEVGDPPDNWTAGNSANLDRHADPNTGTYCLEVNENGADYPYAWQNVSVEEGEQYKISVYVKQGTGTGFWVYVWDNQNADSLLSETGTATGSYVKKSYPFTIPTGCEFITIALYNYVLAGVGTNILYDDVLLFNSNLIDPKADFKSCGVMVGVLIKNTTDGSEGLITSVEEDKIGVTLAGGTNNYWSLNDEYEIYITDTYNSKISSIYVDKSRGWRSDKETLDKGWKPEDVDRDNKEWSDGFPEIPRGG